MVAADCGKDAAQELVSHKFDLVIFDLPVSDLVMRDFSSIGVLSDLIAKGTHVPFLLITGYQTIETAVEAIKNGAHDYVIKPFHRDDLRMKVERALMIHQLQTSLERAYSILLVLIASLPVLFILSVIFGLICAM